MVAAATTIVAVVAASTSATSLVNLTTTSAIIVVTAATAPTPAVVRPNGRQLKQHFKTASGILHSCLHGLVPGRCAEGHSDRCLAIGVRLRCRRGDVRVVWRVHELEADDGAFDRSSVAVLDFHHQRVGHGRSGYRGLTVTGHHAQLSRGSIVWKKEITAVARDQGEKHDASGGEAPGPDSRLYLRDQHAQVPEKDCSTWAGQTGSR